MSEGSPKEETKEEAISPIPDQPPEPKTEDNKPESSFTIDVLINLNNENTSALENVPVEQIKAEIKAEKVEDIKPEIKTENEEPQKRNLFETVGLVLKGAGETLADVHALDNIVFGGDLSEINTSDDAPTVTPVVKPDVTNFATPDVTNFATPDFPDSATPDVIDSATPDVTDSATPDVTDFATPDVTDSATPDVTDSAAPDVTDSAMSVTETSESMTPECEDMETEPALDPDAPTVTLAETPLCEDVDLPTDDEDDDDDESVDIENEADLELPRPNIEFPPVVGPNPKFICQFCEFPAPTFEILQKHLKYHINKNTAKQQCMVCGWWYQEFKPLAEHFLKNHNVTEDQLMKCEHCQFVTLQQASLDDHVKKHFVKKPFACLLCYMSFASSNGCSKHIKNHHSKEEHLKIGFVEKKGRGRNKNAKKMAFYSKLYKQQQEKVSKVGIKSKISGIKKSGKYQSFDPSVVFPVDALHLDCSFCDASVSTKSELAQHLINTHSHEKFPIFGKE